MKFTTREIRPQWVVRTNFKSGEQFVRRFIKRDEAELHFVDTIKAALMNFNLFKVQLIKDRETTYDEVMLWTRNID